jgi:1,4-dihydroxy-2-naphthoate octaprenyltransferase
MATLQAYLGIARAPFLVLPVTLVLSGAAAGAYDGTFAWTRALLALVGLVALHASVNSLNEVSDMQTGVDLHTTRTPFSGGSGTLPSGALPVATAQWFGYGTAAVGLVVGVYLLGQVGMALLPIMLAGGFMVLVYTTVLARLGVGEIAAGLGLGMLPVLGTALVQDGRIGPAAIAASVPAFCMTFNLLFLNEFPDEAADRAGGRKNLVLLLGRKGAARLYSVVAIAAPISIALAVWLGALPWPTLVAIAPSWLLVKPVGWALTSPNEPVSIPALGANVVWNLGTNTLLGVGLIVAMWMR